MSAWRTVVGSAPYVAEARLACGQVERVGSAAALGEPEWCSACRGLCAVAELLPSRRRLARLSCGDAAVVFSDRAPVGSEAFCVDCAVAGDPRAGPTNDEGGSHAYNPERGVGRAVLAP